MTDAYYATAQICCNGHVITKDTSDTEKLSPYCSKCGAKTITECPNCHAPIRGAYCMPGAFLAYAHYTPPAYCCQCGHPFPWTEAKLKAAQDLLYESEELSPEEMSKLATSLPDIVVETPKTIVSANRLSRILRKVSPEIASGVREILINIVVEAAKKTIWPNG